MIHRFYRSLFLLSMSAIFEKFPATVAVFFSPVCLESFAVIARTIGTFSKAVSSIGVAVIVFGIPIENPLPVYFSFIAPCHLASAINK
jgi:hypothetical protein